MRTCKNITKNVAWILYKNNYFCPHMRVKVLIGNPQEFEANSNEEIVLKMKEGGFTASQTISEYMLGYAIRAVHWNNSDIRATDTDSFVEDLIKNKHIEVTDR